MSRPGFFFLVCPDPELVKERIAKLARKFPPEADAGGMGAMLGPGAPTEYERRVFWADEGLSPKFWEALTLTNLMGSPKLVVVRNAQLLLTADWKQLSETLGRPNAQAWPIFCLEKPWERGKPKIPAVITKQPCWKFAQKQKWVWQSIGLTEKTIADHLQAWADARGVRFLPGALHALAAALPPDAAAIRAELEKIELALGGERTIGPEMVELVTFVSEMDFFEFVKVLQKGQAHLAVWKKVLLSQAGGDEMLFPFLASVAREARLMWQLMVGEPVRLPPFVIKEKQALAQRLGARGLARMWDLAMEADLGVKSGERKADQAMEILVAGLADLFHARSERRGAPRMGNR